MLILLAVGVNLLVLFVAVELAVADPLLDVRVIKVWPFVNSRLPIAVLAVGHRGSLIRRAAAATTSP